MDESAHCRERASPPGSNLYYALLNQPAHTHRSLNALFAFKSEIEDILYGTPEPVAIQARLAWWQEETARLFTGEARHPASREIAFMAQSIAMTPAQLSRCIEFNASLAVSRHFEDFDAWLDAAAEAYAGIWQAAADCCGIRSEGSRQRFRRLGGLLAIHDRIQATGRARLHGDAVLPLHGVPALPENGGPLREAVIASLGEVTTRLEGELETWWRQAPRDIRRHALFAPTLARICRIITRELAREPAALLAARTSITPLRKFWAAWRTRYRL